MDLEDIFWLGNRIGYLEMAVFHDYPVKAREKGYILTNLEDLKIFCMDLNINKPTIDSIVYRIKELDKKYKQNQDINKEDKDKLNEKMAGWISIICKELADRKIKEIYTEGTLNWKKLADGAESFLKSKYWRKLPKICKSDLNDAANCINLELPTPSAMIALRATEKVIREFYKNKTGNDSGRKGLKSIIDELSRIAGINKSLLSHLDYIRDNKRNVAEHPQKVFNQEEAERIFINSIDTIEEIYENMV